MKRGEWLKGKPSNNSKPIEKVQTKQQVLCCTLEQRELWKEIAEKEGYKNAASWIKSLIEKEVKRR